MSDLDKKLEEIVSRCDYSNNMIDPIDNPVEQIKQAFKSERWIPFDGRTLIEWRGHRYMTGQGWYEKFENELNTLDNYYFYTKQEVVEAAKKASGIEQPISQEHLIGVFGGLLPNSPIPKREWCVWCGKPKSEIKDEEKCEGIEQ